MREIGVLCDYFRVNQRDLHSSEDRADDGHRAALDWACCLGVLFRAALRRRAHDCHIDLSHHYGRSQRNNARKLKQLDRLLDLNRDTMAGIFICQTVFKRHPRQERALYSQREVGNSLEGLKIFQFFG